MLTAIQQFVTNRLGPIEKAEWIAGIIGERPSAYAKSPTIWNRVIKTLGIDAVYLPFDVTPPDLPRLADTLRSAEYYVGGSVTVPYKVSIVPYLDSLDKKAAEIGAVNTIVRTAKGELIGFNTDGKGALDSLKTIQPGQDQPFIGRADATRVLLIGAGGAGRAVGFYLAEELRNGALLITSRNEDRCRALVEGINRIYRNTVLVRSRSIYEVLSSVDVVINASTCGQSGIQQVNGNLVTCLEPYSALAAANPAELPAPMAVNQERFFHKWLPHSIDDIIRNHSEALRLCAKVPMKTAFFDLVYSPTETVFLRYARLTGHRTMNGKGMNIAQAANAFFHLVFRSWLEKAGQYNEKTFGSIVGQMYAAW